MSNHDSPLTDSIDRRRFLASAAGATATAIAFPAVGTAAAHFPEDLEIDIKPGSDENPIKPNARGSIPVAVHHTEAFDPTSEGTHYRFGAPDAVGDGGGARPVRHSVEDVNGDGDDDLVLHFPADDTGFDGDEDEGALFWEREEGAHHGLSGTDTVTIVGSE